MLVHDAGNRSSPQHPVFIALSNFRPFTIPLKMEVNNIMSCRVDPDNGWGKIKMGEVKKIMGEIKYKNE